MILREYPTRFRCEGAQAAARGDARAIGSRCDKYACGCVRAIGGQVTAWVGYRCGIRSS